MNPLLATLGGKVQARRTGAADGHSVCALPTAVLECGQRAGLVRVMDKAKLPAWLHYAGTWHPVKRDENGYRVPVVILERDVWNQIREVLAAAQAVVDTAPTTVWWFEMTDLRGALKGKK